MTPTASGRTRNERSYDVKGKIPASEEENGVIWEEAKTISKKQNISEIGQGRGNNRGNKKKKSNRGR